MGGDPSCEGEGRLTAQKVGGDPPKVLWSGERAVASGRGALKGLGHKDGGLGGSRARCIVAENSIHKCSNALSSVQVHSEGE